MPRSDLSLALPRTTAVLGKRMPYCAILHHIVPTIRSHFWFKLRVARTNSAQVMFVVFAMAAAFIFETHSNLLRGLSDEAGTHFNGLEIAARHFKRRIPGAMYKKLQRFDIAFALVRHITGPDSSHFAKELQRTIELSREGIETNRCLGTPMVAGHSVFREIDCDPPVAGYSAPGEFVCEPPVADHSVPREIVSELPVAGYSVPGDIVCSMSKDIPRCESSTQGEESLGQASTNIWLPEIPPMPIELLPPLAISHEADIGLHSGNEMRRQGSNLIDGGAANTQGGAVSAHTMPYLGSQVTMNDCVSVAQGWSSPGRGMKDADNSPSVGAQFFELKDGDSSSVGKEDDSSDTDWICGWWTSDGGDDSDINPMWRPNCLSPAEANLICSANLAGIQRATGQFATRASPEGFRSPAGRLAHGSFGQCSFEECMEALRRMQNTLDICNVALLLSLARLDF